MIIIQTTMADNVAKGLDAAFKQTFCEFIEKIRRHKTDTAKPAKIFVKPNLVLHEADELRGSGCVVTQAYLVDWVVRRIWDTYAGQCQIIVGDVPLQTCQWDKMIAEAGYVQALASWRENGIDVQLLDLRREWRPVRGGHFQEKTVALPGDPLGYALINLGSDSFLEPVSHSAHKFAVTDYSDQATRSRHAPNRHEYLIPRSAIECDLFVNLPKLKTHQKAGVTVALKNLIGINGDKAYLPHHRNGCPRFGGDEFRDERWWLGYAHTTARRRLQGSFKPLFSVAHNTWKILRSFAGIHQNAAASDGSTAGLFVTDGAWHGNDTIWRTVLDINQILFFVGADGRLQSEPRPNYVCLVDGFIAGEGNGPLRPKPKTAGVVLYGDNPVEMDRACAHLMGFDPERIPLLKDSNFSGTRLQRYADVRSEIRIVDDRGVVCAQGGTEVIPNLKFEPPPGWKGHIEKSPKQIVAEVAITT